MRSLDPFLPPSVYSLLAIVPLAKRQVRKWGEKINQKHKSLTLQIML